MDLGKHPQPPAITWVRLRECLDFLLTPPNGRGVRSSCWMFYPPLSFPDDDGVKCAKGAKVLFPSGAPTHVRLPRRSLSTGAAFARPEMTMRQKEKQPTAETACSGNGRWRWLCSRSMRE